MSCDQVKDKLNAYLDNELAPHDKESVSAHLSACEACQKILAHLQNLTLFVQGSIIPDPPQNLMKQIITKTRLRHSNPSFLSQFYSVFSNWWFLETPAMHVVAVVSLLFTLSFGSFLGWSIFINHESPSMNSTNQTALLLSAYNLDVLSDLPEGSLPHAYLTLSSTSTKKEN
jgi:hypothetical protein